MARPITSAAEQIRRFLPELLKFGIVGLCGAVVDLGGSAVLYGTYHLGPLTSKAIAVSASCVVTYLGSRFWSFAYRRNQALLRETILFILLNGIGLLIAEAVIAITHYAFGATNQIAFNAASVLGTGLGTIFRFWSYRKWVFLAPLPPAVPVPATVLVPPDTGPPGAGPPAILTSSVNGAAPPGFAVPPPGEPADTHPAPRAKKPREVLLGKLIHNAPAVPPAVTASGDDAQAASDANPVPGTGRPAGRHHKPR